MEKLEQILQFIREAEGLKSVLRTAWTAAGRQESTAEHSWRLALLATVLLDEFSTLDAQKVLVLCLVHDIGELYCGDISAAKQPDKVQKYSDELAAVHKLCAMLPKKSGHMLFAVWEEYENEKTPEALFVKALDKAETIIQHNQGKNPADFDYAFNFRYGEEYFEQNKILKELRVLIDADTAAHIKEAAEPDYSLLK